MRLDEAEAFVREQELAAAREEGRREERERLRTAVAVLPAHSLEVMTRRHWVSGLHIDRASVLALLADPEPSDD